MCIRDRNKLFDETMAGLMFTVAGEEEELSLEATLHLLTDTDRAKREAAARALAVVFDKNIKLFARVHNTLAKEKEIEDRWRKMPSPQYSRHLANHVEPEVVEALRNAVVAAYPKLSHRYYRLKAKWMGLETLQVWDRNAPLPSETPRLVNWTEAREIVEEAYGAFDPRMAELAKPFFTKGWIDAGEMCIRDSPRLAWSVPCARSARFHAPIAGKRPPNWGCHDQRTDSFPAAADWAGRISQGSLRHCPKRAAGCPNRCGCLCLLYTSRCV